MAESKKVADFVCDELRRVCWDEAVGPIGLTYTCNGKQMDYIDLTTGVGL